MSALTTRAYLQAQQQYYLTPLALVGEAGQQMPAWIEAGVKQADSLTPVLAEDGKQLLARGYEVSRTCVCGELSWQERVLVVRSHAYAETQHRHLQARLEKAQAALLALTPPVGRGKRQITEQAVLQSAAEAVLTKHHVRDLLTYTYERESEQEITFVGRGRGEPPTTSERAGALSDHDGDAQRGGDCPPRVDLRLAGLCHQCASEALVLRAGRAGISSRVPHRTRLRALKRGPALHCAHVCPTGRSGDRIDAFAECCSAHAHAPGVRGAPLLEAARSDAGGTLQG